MPPLPPSIHVSVMAPEAVAGLAPKPNGIYVDGTLGGATQTRMILDACAPHGRVFSFDVDPVALARAGQDLAGYGERWTGIEANFRHLERELGERGIGAIDGLLLDLGFSSDELVRPDIGLSFQENGALDMRFGPTANDDGLTAAEIVNQWPVQDIETLIRNFGEDTSSRRIAEAIGEARRKERIVTTSQLVGVIHGVLPRHPKDKVDPATKTFQALRIIVNDEIESLKIVLKSAERLVRPGGRVSVISFHSIEDRVVKQWLKESESFADVFDGPRSPSDDEVLKNPRSRSAKLRVAEKRS